MRTLRRIMSTESYGDRHPEALPKTYSSDTLYRSNQVIGGGVAAELFGIPSMDPLAGALAMRGDDASLRTLLTLTIPVVLALVAGRAFVVGSACSERFHGHSTRSARGFHTTASWRCPGGPGSARAR